MSICIWSIDLHKLAIIAVCLFVFGGAPVAAAGFNNCTKAETTRIIEALAGSKRLALQSAAAVGDTPIYSKWFGKFTPQNGEKVRATLKTIVTAIRSGAVTASCENKGEDGCQGDTYAWVFPDEPYLVHLCPSFFDLPRLDGLDPDDPKIENGTQAGTMIHEISHFLSVADTIDHCYARGECSQMAQFFSQDAIENADSYQYFAEDVAFFAAHPDRSPDVPEMRISKP